MLVFLKQMESAEARGPLPNWSDVSAYIQEAIQEGLTGQKSPADAMKAAAAVIDPLLPK
jgi:multiple sugar transport system substrate-binding protein